MRQGKARDAIDHYREAERLNPDDFLGFFSEADAIARLGNLGEARQLLTRTLVLRPRRETVLKVLACVYSIDDEEANTWKRVHASFSPSRRGESRRWKRLAEARYGPWHPRTCRRSSTSTTPIPSS